MIQITRDNITPWLKRTPRKLRKSTITTTNNLLRWGAKRAKKRVAGQISKDLYNNIGYIPARKDKPGVLYSTSKKRGTTSFPYHLWVNRNIKSITGRRPFFSDDIQVGYGDKRTKAHWRMEPAYFTKTRMEMQRRFPKLLKRYISKFIMR